MRTAMAKSSRWKSVKVAPEASAAAAGLTHTDDAGPGITRSRRGPGFRYLDASGAALTDPETLGRIKALVIPPAWEGVWISPDPSGHLQATGRDEKGRKQYRYHPRWRSVRDDSKFGRMQAFAGALPKIRSRVDDDLSRPGLPKEKVVAAVVRLLETTLIRVGNDEYAKTNGSYGLTTMRDRHVQITGGSMTFTFKGKSGVRHAIDLDDRRLAKVVAGCRDLPGQDLFQYRGDDGEIRDVGSADVNAYLREASGHDFTAKDFRTWSGTVLASIALREFEAFDSQAQAKKNILRAIESVSARLGNTPSVCRKCYIHPAIFDAYLDGSTVQTLKQIADDEMAEIGSLKPEEAAVLALLRLRLARTAEGAPPPETALPATPRTPARRQSARRRTRRSSSA